MFKARKGQTEVVGLLIIVILLIFIGYIYLQFSIAGKDDGYEDVRQSIYASGFLRALLDYNGGGEGFQELVSYCYYDASECDSLRIMVVEVFSGVLKGDEDYKLVLTGDERNILEIGGCERGVVSRIPYTLEGVFYEGVLMLCRKK